MPFSAPGARFPGQYYDAESGLHYNTFRDYDPTTGRYIESDPIRLRGGVNTYGYVGGNPLSHIDPYGLQEPGLVTCVAGPNPVCGTFILITTCKWILIRAGIILATGIVMNAGCNEEKCKDIPQNQPPFRGEPGSTVRGGTGSRTYGPDGYPGTDRDWPHPDEGPPGNDDHCHDWCRPPDGGPPIGPKGEPNPYRGNPRLPIPSDPPPPRGPNVPIP